MKTPNKFKTGFVRGVRGRRSGGGRTAGLEEKSRGFRRCGYFGCREVQYGEVYNQYHKRHYPCLRHGGPAYIGRYRPDMPHLSGYQGRFAYHRNGSLDAD